jgi:ribonuclease T2
MVSSLEQRMRIVRLVVAILAVLGWSSVALAQAAQCVIPQSLPSARAESPPLGAVREGTAAGFTLALSWSPQFCRGRGDAAQFATQCAAATPFGFILHGLWPENGRDDPQWCKPVKPLSRDQLRQSFCAMPSVVLQQHQWAKHGSCITPDPARYFRVAGLLYNAIKAPDMDRLSRARPNVGAFKAAFARANPGISPDMISVTTERGWLEDVRICLGLNYRPARCPRGTQGAAARSKLKIWRAEG